MDAPKKPEKRGLGRGLSALLADVGTPTATSTAAPTPDSMLPIEALSPNPDQPRRYFGEDELAELAASIEQKGILQPLIVRPDPKVDGHYQIVAGERRWRAAQIARQHEVPVLVREFTDTDLLEVGIIENIQRADLNAVEEAMGYRQLMDRFGHTQERLAEAMGKSRSHIANLLRLLTLPDDVLSWVRDGTLSPGHARTLVTARQPSKLAAEVIRRGLSVRAAEKLARDSAAEPPNAAASATPVAAKDADTRALEADLTAQLGLKVTIAHRGTAGELRITYRDLDELDGLCQLLSGGD
ncbi:MAG: ParB/RepB/Spo0J family partition protein [Pseudomonadota bacterium]